MDVIILAGGFAKRMGALSRDIPKPLLPIGEKPVTQYIIEKIDIIPQIENIYLTTNLRFKQKFIEFISRLKLRNRVEIVVEPGTSEENKLGSIGAIHNVIQLKSLKRDLLVVAGDNYFSLDLHLFVKEYFKNRQNLIGLFNIADLEKVKLYGEVTIDANNKVTTFREKPARPKSTLVSTAVYVLNERGVQGIYKYIDEGLNRDTFGRFIEWFSNREDIYGYLFDGFWIDIGNPKNYQDAMTMHDTMH